MNGSVFRINDNNKKRLCQNIGIVIKQQIKISEVIRIYKPYVFYMYSDFCHNAKPSSWPPAVSNGALPYMDVSIVNMK